MGLLEDIATEHAKARVTVCIVARWLHTLPKKEQAEVLEAIFSDYPIQAKFRVISKKYPGRFAERAFHNHVKATCCCVPQG